MVLYVGHGSNFTLNKQEEVPITAKWDGETQELYGVISKQWLSFWFAWWVSLNKTFAYVTSHKTAAELAALDPTS